MWPYPSTLELTSKLIGAPMGTTGALGRRVTCGRWPCEGRDFVVGRRSRAPSSRTICHPVLALGDPSTSAARAGRYAAPQATAPARDRLMVKLRLIGMSCSFSVARADRLKSMSSRAAHRQDANTGAIAELFHRFGGPHPSGRPPRRGKAAGGQQGREAGGASGRGGGNHKLWVGPAAEG